MWSMQERRSGRLPTQTCLMPSRPRAEPAPLRVPGPSDNAPLVDVLAELENGGLAIAGGRRRPKGSAGSCAESFRRTSNTHWCPMPCGKPCTPGEPKAYLSVHKEWHLSCRE